MDLLAGVAGDGGQEQALAGIKSSKKRRHWRSAGAGKCAGLLDGHARKTMKTAGMPKNKVHCPGVAEVGGVKAADLPAREIATTA